MPLTQCPDCGKSVSTSAASCPHCGRPISASPIQGVTPPAGGRVCPHCGSQQVGKVRGLQGVGEAMTFIILFFSFIVPAIVYYIYIESRPYCSGCGRRL